MSHTAGNGYVATVKLLLEHHIEADSKDDIGRTPLSYTAEGLSSTWLGASNYSHEATIELLLGREDIDAGSMDKEGRTPLFWAENSRWRSGAIEDMLRSKQKSRIFAES